MSQHFTFLQTEWPSVHEAAAKAEKAVYADPRTACFYSRRALEIAVAWLYKHDASLRLPYQDNLSALIHEPTFKSAVGSAVFAKAKVIKDLGNLAVHSHKKILESDALAAVRELFHVSYWLAHTYARGVKVSGMPNEQGCGFVDYVLWGDDGKPLGIVGAKRTRKSPQIGQQQAKLYADCLEQQFGQRPVIFYTNGYEHWIWDDASYPPRQVQGFYKKAELELLIQRRRSRKKLADAEINAAIVERYYQTRALRRTGEAFEIDYDRKSLLVMATGGGKTRAVIALCDLLMRCNWVKRVLFLADRVALVKQAVNAFKKHLPDSAPVNLVTEKETDSRVFVSTYPTMMGLIDETKDGHRHFGVGHFDLVIIVRTQHRLVEKFSDLNEWKTLNPDALQELVHQVAGLPSEIETDDEEAKRFDLLMLRLQLAQLHSEPGFARIRDQVKAIAGLLEEKATIPVA